jgi:hypothetical protein
VEPALFERAPIGPEYRLERKRRRACKGMLLDPDRIIDAVEFDRPAERRIDDPRSAFNRGFVAADVLEPVERPDGFSARLASRHRTHTASRTTAPCDFSADDGRKLARGPAQRAK